MLKWLSGEEGEPGSRGPDSPPAAAGNVDVDEMAERLTQTEHLVTQLKEMIREKDAALRTKDDHLKVEKEACEAKLSKLRLQNKAKVTSLTNQIEELKKQQGSRGMLTHSKKGSAEGGGEQANRGKIVLLKKKVEELEQLLAQKEKELETKSNMVVSQRQRGEEIDAMLTEKDRKLAEKEAYIVHLQSALTGEQHITPVALQQVVEDSGGMHKLQLLVQSLTRKVGEAEERYSLLQEQTDSLKELLATDKEQYSQNESMYQQNIQTFKDIILQKDNQLMEINQMHEQELFKIAAKSDASADLEQLLKALKQKLHEKEEVLLGKTQVIDVLQEEVDGRDQQINELTERLRRMQVERESLESKMEAEKHVMRAQLRDLMEKQQAEVQRMSDQHKAQMNQVQQDLMGQLEELRRVSLTAPPTTQQASGCGKMDIQRIAELEAQAKQKTDEASKSEAKFLKMKAWSKSRIRQLEEEMKKSHAGVSPPDLTALRSRIKALEEEREENMWKLEQYEELKTVKEMLEAKLVVYEEQQRTLQADLEQFTKRAASQTSESGSADDTQSQVLEWQEMVGEVVSARDRVQEEKAAMALRISHMEDEREALATQQQELEEELAQARGLSRHRAKKLAAPAERSLQEDFVFDGQAPFQDLHSNSESTTPMEGENMGGWWPEYSTPDTDGLRSVVEELEQERNQLQEQILRLEEHCQDLEDRLQLQARIEALQNESEKLQNQLVSVRNQQSRDAEKQQVLVNSLNEQLKGLTDTKESLECSLIEKENTLAKTSEKLELINTLQESLSEKEIHYKEVSDKLLQTEQTLENVSKKYSSSERQCVELKTEVADVLLKLNILKEKTQKQEVNIETLQTELDQTNEELDKLNTAHLEERDQLIYDLQSCEREIDSLKDILFEKDKEIAVLTGNMAEYTEQVTVLKQEIQLKEENLVHVENALNKAEQDAKIIRDSQNLDQQALHNKITELVGKLKETEAELVKAKEQRESKVAEVEHLLKQAEVDKKSIQDLQGEIQKQIVSHCSHLSECETHITSLKEQLNSATQKLHESERLISQLNDKNYSNEKLQQQIHDKEQIYEKELKSFKEEQNRFLTQEEKYNNEMQTLCKKLEEQIQTEEHIKKEVLEKLETITSLENQLKANKQQTRHEREKYIIDLQGRDSENQKLSIELQSKSENISKLKDILKTMKTENQQLHDELKVLNEELELQKQNVKELNKKCTSVVEINNSLEKQVCCFTQEIERLEFKVTENETTVSEVTHEKDSLQAKISALEKQQSQNFKIIEGLQKDTEELTAEKNDLNKVLEQSTQSTSEILLAKTNECCNLYVLLREKEDKMTQLLEQVQCQTSLIDQLQNDVAKREQTVSDLQEAQKYQQTELQETLSVLQDQECGLKSAIIEKDAMFKEKQERVHHLENEITSQKNVVSKLQAEAKILSEECLKLRQQLEDKDEILKNMTQQCQKHKDELNDKNKVVKALSEQISVMEENVRRLESEAELSRTELVSHNSRIQSLMEENQLHAACERELTQQMQVVSGLNEQLKAALGQNSSLSVEIKSSTEDNQRLQKEVAQKTKLISDITTEYNLLQEKKSGLEIQISDNQKTIKSLLLIKEDLTVKADDLEKVLKETELSNSAGLLEKTSECANLSNRLKQKEDQLQSLDEQVVGLKLELGQLKECLNEKEQTVSEQILQLEAQQNQLLQVQDTVSMLQEQGSVLKSGLMEKDTMFQQKEEECCVYQNELRQQKCLITQMQDEVEVLRQKCLEVKKQVEQKEQALIDVTHEFQIHKDELNKRNESVILLSSQLGVINESSMAVEAEITKLKATVQKLTAENCHLTQQVDQSKAEIINFTDCVQALNEQKANLKSELQKMTTDLSSAQEEISYLKTAVCDCDNELKTAQSERKTLNFTIQERDMLLKQQESLIQQLSSRIVENEEQLKQKADKNDCLSTKVSELEDRVCKLKRQVDSLTTESSTLKNTLEIKEQSSLEYQSHSSAVFANLSSDLQAKEAECESLKEQISHLEESVTKLNSTLEVHVAEVENLKRALEEKETALLDKSKSLQDVNRRANEAMLFKAQFMESTELVSELHGQIQLLSTECEDLKRSAEETRSDFSNLQEKYAANLEELEDVKKQLSQRNDEVSHLQKLLYDSSNECQTAVTIIETLRVELSATHCKLEQITTLNSSLSKEKDEAFVQHQESVSLLTVEIEGLKSKHLEAVAQMNALTENLEQREMALHVINSQFTVQAKHASQLVVEIQKLEEQNKRLNEKISLLKEENQQHLNAFSNDNIHLQQEVRKLLAEKEEMEQKYREICTSQGEIQVDMEQQSSSTKVIMEKMVSEKESLQAKVSAKDEELFHLKENIQKIEQILQDSEKEWLLVLDKEKQDKNLLAQQLRSVENEMKSKDVKVNALKQHLDSLQEKLAEASSALRQGSNQLNLKESEVSASRIQLEKVLASVQEKDYENNILQQTLKTVEYELQKLVVRKNGTDKNSSALPPTSSQWSSASSLQDMIKKLQESHQAEIDDIKNELDKTIALLQKTQTTLNEWERSNNEKCQQIALLQHTVEVLQTQLKCATEKVNESAVKHSSLHCELLAKDEQISCMSIQINQQKELLTGMSQQLRDKDASIAQVIEAASSERMKLSEENSSLSVQLENMEKAHKTSIKSEIETNNSEKTELIKKNDDLKSELSKLAKVKDALKKKLQAALNVRKELLKKVEEYETQQEESVNNKTEVLLLQEKLQEVTNQSAASEKMHHEHVFVLEKKIFEIKEEILAHKTQSESLVKQLMSEKQILQTTLNDKETCLSDILQTLNEKNVIIKQLQYSAAGKEEEFERERNGFIRELEKLENEIKSCNELKEKASIAVVFDLENELTQIKSEKATLQKNVQAALLARKETIKKAQDTEKKLTQELAELKDDYKTLLEQYQQTNELKAIQLNFDEKVKELEDLHETCLSYMNELDALRQLVKERDETVQDLKMSLAEKERQCPSLSHLQTEMENVKIPTESIPLQLVRKDEALVDTEQRACVALKSTLHLVENEFETACAELRENEEEMKKYQEATNVEQEKEAVFNENIILNLNMMQTSHMKCICANKCPTLMEEKEADLEQSNQMKVEIGATVALVSQRSLEVLAIQKTLAEKQQQLSEDKAVLSKELKKAKLYCTDTEMSLDLLNMIEIKQDGKKERICCYNCAENFAIKLKEKDDTIKVIQALVSEKEGQIAALKLQIKQQIKLHGIAIEKLTPETDDLQKSKEDNTKMNSQDNQNRIALLSRKLQAALISRKELLKENSTLKEEAEKLSARHKDKESEYVALELAMLKLKQQNVDLENFVSSLNKEKDQLSTQVECILNDNQSLSAACDSLKLTIENITQQKQAFSCQLESLKDFQTEELSKWKSKHVELKQEYETLLQAYENVSSEMEKMRQLLEGAKRDRQEALRKIQKRETERKILERQARMLEEENERLKEKMQQLSTEKQQKIETLEEENKKIRTELTVIDENHKKVWFELTNKQQPLEAEICQLKESTEDLKIKLTEALAENNQLAENLEKANCSLKKKLLESNAYTNGILWKLDEALSLNNSLTAQIEIQKTELDAQLEINNLLQKEKPNLSTKAESIQIDYELQLGKKNDIIKELESIINKHSQKTISLNEKVRILEDDKCLLQQELDNVQEISNKVKNENEYLQNVILKNAERIKEPTESVSVLQSQNIQMSSQLAASKENSQVCQEKEEEQLKLFSQFEEKPKTVQEGNEGSKIVKNELQEILQVKDREINQLQQNCNNYQEFILDLESVLKRSQSSCEHLEKERKKCLETISVLEERSKQVEVELITHKNLLQEATETIVSIQSERDQLAIEISQQSKQSADQAVGKLKLKENIDEKQINMFMENQFLFQQQIEELNDLKDKENEMVNELEQQQDSQDLELNSLKRAAETNEAKLCALSSTSQGAAATKLWNELYKMTLHEKDDQLLEQGFVMKMKFLEEIRVKDKELNDLRAAKTRLERTVSEYSVLMSSLQSEQKRLSEYGILEAKSELGLNDGSADGEGAATKGHQHEVRKLLHQVDDLNSENAMLRAQLVQYREDLNQVLCLKDNQLKMMLKKQQDVIKNLENQKTFAEKQHSKSLFELQNQVEVCSILKTENSQLKTHVLRLEAEILSKNKERAANEGKVIADLQEAVATRAAECKDLQQKLLSQKSLTDEVTEKLHTLENETEANLAEAEAKCNRELDAFKREMELMRNDHETADKRVAELAKDLHEIEQQLSEAKLQSKAMKAQNKSLCKAMAALQNDRDHLIEDFKILKKQYDNELRETQAAFNKVERSLQDTTSDLVAFSKERDILILKLKAIESKEVNKELNRLLDELSKSLSAKERELKQIVLENNTLSRHLSAFSRSMASLQNDRDRLIDELVEIKRAVESSQMSTLQTALSADSCKGSEDNAVPNGKDRLETVALLGQSQMKDVVGKLEAERVQLHSDLQHCVQQIQQRDQHFQQLNTKLQQAVEERGAVVAQLRAVSQTLVDTQNRCHWLESQLQSQAQGSVYAEVAPGAPQERSSDSVDAKTPESRQLRERLLEMELSLADERARRELVEEALCLAEERAKSAASCLSRDSQRDFSIEVETEEEWEALSLNPDQPLITRKVKGGMVACRRWLRGRSLYFSRLLTSRARSRYFFLAYLFTIHVLVLMCLTGSL